METMPVEILREILSYLPLPSLQTFRLVCRSFVKEPKDLMIPTICIAYKKEALDRLFNIQQDKDFCSGVKKIKFQYLNLLQIDTKEEFEVQLSLQIEDEVEGENRREDWAQTDSDALQRSRNWLRSWEQYQALYANRKGLRENKETQRLIVDALRRMPGIKHLELVQERWYKEINYWNDPTFEKLEPDQSTKYDIDKLGVDTMAMFDTMVQSMELFKFSIESFSTSEPTLCSKIIQLRSFSTITHLSLNSVGTIECYLPSMEKLKQLKMLKTLSLSNLTHQNIVIEGIDQVEILELYECGNQWNEMQLLAKSYAIKYCKSLRLIRLSRLPSARIIQTEFIIIQNEFILCLSIQNGTYQHDFEVPRPQEQAWPKSLLWPVNFAKMANFSWRYELDGMLHYDVCKMDGNGNKIHVDGNCRQVKAFLLANSPTGFISELEHEPCLFRPAPDISISHSVYM